MKKDFLELHRTNLLKIIEYCSKVLANIPDKRGSNIQEYAKCLFTKLLYHCNTALLIIRSQNSMAQEYYHDFSTLMLLSRSVYEAYLNFSCNFIIPKSDEERDFVFSVLNLYAKSERRELLKKLHFDSEEFKNDFTNYTNFVKSNVFFLKQQQNYLLTILDNVEKGSSFYNEILKYKKKKNNTDFIMNYIVQIFFESMNKKADRCSLHDSISFLLYKYTSLYAHNDLLAYDQIYDIKEPADTLKMCIFPFFATVLFTALSISAIGRILPEIMEGINANQEIKGIIEYYENIKNNDLSSFPY